jgi:hypothetical protein
MFAGARGGVRDCTESLRAIAAAAVKSVLSGSASPSDVINQRLPVSQGNARRAASGIARRVNPVASQSAPNATPSPGLPSSTVAKLPFLEPNVSTENVWSIVIAAINDLAAVTT